MEIPKAGRATIIEGFDDVKIIISAKANYLMIIAPAAMATMFYFTFGQELFHKKFSQDPFFYIFSSVWISIVLFSLLTTLVWGAIGQEIIEVSKGLIYIRRKGDWSRLNRSYDLTEARSIRAEESESFFAQSPFAYKSDTRGVGTICFEYGRKTIRFGDGLSQAEGNVILQKLKAKNLV